MTTCLFIIHHHFKASTMFHSISSHVQNSTRQERYLNSLFNSNRFLNQNTGYCKQNMKYTSVYQSSFKHVNSSESLRNYFVQECIPVGCVPSTAVSVYPGRGLSGGCLPRGCLPQCMLGYIPHEQND